MNLPGVLLTRLCWLNLPAALLIALLQRTPVLRVLAGAGDALALSPAGQLVRSAFTAAALGALHSRAGATTFRAVQGTGVIIQTGNDGHPEINLPATGNLDQAITPVTFTYLQTPAEPARFQFTGSLPPGLAFTTPIQGNNVLARAPSISGTPQAAGTFTIRVQGFSPLNDTNNVQQPITFVISGGAASAPVIASQPQSHTVAVGAPVTFAVQATGTPAPSFQWRHNGTPIAGATNSTYVIDRADLADAGDYTVVASNSAGSVTSAPAALSIFARTDPAARLTNLSVRTALGADQPLIVGVVVDGGSRDLLVRAAGPALAEFGLGNAMGDPQLELYNGPTRVLANNDWEAALEPVFGSVGAFPFGARSRDAAFVQGITGAHSIQARGTGAGVVLVEAYDTTGTPGARLVNVSARNRVGTGDDLLIAGFNIAGGNDKLVLVRAVGPGLAGFGVADFLRDPKLEIYDAGGGKVAENDNWSAGLADNFRMVGAFDLPAGSRDAALLTVLPAGSFTAQVRGGDGGTGEALIEIYEVR